MSPSGSSRAAAEVPVRAVHLGLGSFFRAHQAWYTQHAQDGMDWPIAAFSGRRAELARALASQQGRYTLVTRGPDADRFEIIDRVVAAYPGDDHVAWLRHLGSSEARVLTLTVTEAAYLQRADGGPDLDHPRLRTDLEALRRDPGAPVGTVPARLVAGLLARRDTDAGPLTIVPCDNLADNGAVVEATLRDVADHLDPELSRWIEAHVRVVTTMVDRITPATTEDDRRGVATATGWDDRVPVVTEPFSEWVLAGDTSGLPAWNTAGATFTDRILPFEQRKLWLLNGAHSLLAYVGRLRGHTTVAEALGDPLCREWVERWWDEAGEHLETTPDELERYRAALRERFANSRMRHRLDQIAVDGSLKLPLRIVPVLRLHRAAGRLPEVATLALASWIACLWSGVAPVDDARAQQLSAILDGGLTDAVPPALGLLDPDLAADPEVVTAVTTAAQRLGHSRR